MTESPPPDRNDDFFPRLALAGLTLALAIGILWMFVVNRPAIAGVTPPGQPGPILAVPTDRPSGIRPPGSAARASQPRMPAAQARPAAPAAAPAAPRPPAATARPDADPASAGEAASLGNQASQRSDYETAVREFTRAIELAPTATYYGLRGDVYWRSGKLTESMADYDQAIALDPGNADSYYGRARVYRDMGKKAEAVNDLLQFLDLKPDDDVNAGVRQQAQQWIDELR